MQQKGFTLVELAIVMTIIGLLIGGILKGQELLENARVTSTIAQVKSYDAAITTFRDMYDSWPGDLPDAANRIPGCNAACTLVSTDSYGEAGDGRIGRRDRVMDEGVGVVIGGGTDDETTLFWMHLLKANLITGVTSDPLTSATVADGEPIVGISNPAAKIGGGFVMWYVNDFFVARSGMTLPAANTLMLANEQLRTAYPSGQNAVTPLRAEQIDRKIDDGKPLTGTVQGVSVDNICYSSLTTDAVYNSTVSSKDCGLAIQLQQ